MNNEMYHWLIDHQYEMPSRLYYLADKFPKVTWQEARRLYALAVEEVLITYRAKHLYDTNLSYGRGLLYARQNFERMLRQLQTTIEVKEKV